MNQPLSVCLPGSKPLERMSSGCSPIFKGQSLSYFSKKLENLSSISAVDFGSESEWSTNQFPDAAPLAAAGTPIVTTSGWVQSALPPLKFRRFINQVEILSGFALCFGSAPCRYFDHDYRGPGGVLSGNQEEHLLTCHQLPAVSWHRTTAASVLSMN